MKRNYKYFLSVIPPFLTIFGNLNGDFWVFTNFVFSLIVLALAELMLPDDNRNEHDEGIYFPDILLFVHVIVQLVCWITLVKFSISDTTILFVFGAALSTGVSTGSSGIVIAHELIHRKKIIYNFSGRLLLFLAGNVYFFIDHIKGHHKNVGLISDAATAKRNESVYKFFIRSVKGQFIFSLRSEIKRLTELGKHPYGIGNYVVRSVAYQIILIVGLYVLFGPIAALAYLTQALLANFLLEYINYIEHYGLIRQPGTKVTELHSWQSDKFISRFFLIDLSRHADHHNHASKPYQKLNSYKDSPVLPGGYATNIYLALIPPLWFMIMNKKLDKMPVPEKTFS